MFLTFGAAAHMATTLIVSDIHLGAANSRATLLDHLLRTTSFDRLILNGDTLDSLNLCRLGADCWALLQTLRRLARRRQLVVVRGNHDVGRPLPDNAFGPADVLGQLLEVEMVEECSVHVGGRSYLVMHGDQFDPTLRWTRLGVLADWIYNRLQLCSRALARAVKQLVKLWGGVVSSVRRGALEYAASLGYNGAIAGHTHFHEDCWIDGLHYLNTGCWVDTPCTYLQASASEITLRYLDGGSGGTVTWLPRPRLAAAARLPVSA